MPLTQATAGNRIVTTDVNQFYNILKGVSGSGETITLIYNAAASLIFQPSSDPAAGTEAVQIKNNAGTVQGSLTFDGKFKSADGTAALPSHRMQSEATGMYLASASTLGFSTGGTHRAEIGATYFSVGSSPAASGTFRGPTSGTIIFRNAANNGDIQVLTKNASDNLSLNTGTKIDFTTGGTLRAEIAATQATFAAQATATSGGAEILRFGTGASGVLGVYFGSGAPTVSAPQGSLYLRTDGSSTTTRAYINTNGSTTWTAISTVA